MCWQGGEQTKRDGGKQWRSCFCRTRSGVTPCPTNAGMQKQAERMQGRSDGSKSCKNSFPGSAGVLEPGILVTATNTEFMGEEARVGGHSPPPLLSVCCWMASHGRAALQTPGLCLCQPWIL